MKWPRRMGLLLAMALMAASIYAGLQIYLRHTVNRHLEAFVQTTAAISGIQYARLDVRLLPFGVELQQVALKPAGGADPIPIRRVHLDRFQPGAVFPDQLSLDLDGVRIPNTHPAVDPIRFLLKRVALKTLLIDLRIRLVHDASQAGTWHGHLELQVQRMGILRGALVVDNLDANGVLQAFDNPFNWLAVLPPAGIRTMVWEFEDNGLVARIVADRARRSDMTPAAARQHIRQGIEAAARHERIWPLGRLLSEYVADPVRIGYYTGNPEPVYLGRLLWSRSIRDGLRPLQVSGYRAPTPRLTPWVTAATSSPGKPPRL